MGRNMFGMLVGLLGETALGGIGGLFVPGQFPWGFGPDGLWSGLQAFSLFGWLGCLDRPKASEGPRPARGPRPAPSFWRGAGWSRVEAAEFRASVPVPDMGEVMGDVL